MTLAAVVGCGATPPTTDATTPEPEHVPPANTAVALPPAPPPAAPPRPSEVSWNAPVESLSAEQCAASVHCKEHGLCALRPDRPVVPATSFTAETLHQLSCEAASDEHCRASTYCQQWGYCTSEAGRCCKEHETGTLCVPQIQCPGHLCRDTTACDKEPWCENHGGCTAVFGACRPMSDTDCKMSTSCIREGRCSASGPECTAASDDDCATSLGCKDDGRCLARDGQCVQGKP